VAETIFAGEEVKEFALEDESARFAVRDAEVMEFPNDFFVRDGPRNGCNRKGDNKQIQNLQRYIHSPPLTTDRMTRFSGPRRQTSWRSDPH
jgi:hypothetical protein